MEIELKQIPVKDVYNGYKDSGEDGVVGYQGQLNIRPPYQRNFVYDLPEAKAVINTVLHGFPLNVMYWVVDGNNHYEVLDGQQRTLSIMQFLDHKFPIQWDGQTMYVDSLPDDLYNNLMDYNLMVYWCSGTDSEKLAWFKTVNIAGEQLTSQELRNITYVGPWLSDAKRHFSKRGCVASKLADRYVKGDPNRQELLETALKWIADAQDTTIDDYMAQHKSDDDADELWQYWQKVINWLQMVFPQDYKEMKGLDWGLLYNQYHKNDYNSSKIDKDIAQLIDDDEIKKKKGIWQYELAVNSNEAGATKYLNLRGFAKDMMRKKLKEQDGHCPMCIAEGNEKVYTLSEMEGDHITPWSKGGKTEYDNLQMLCKRHNRLKSNH